MRKQHLSLSLTIIFTILPLLFLIFWLPQHEEQITTFTIQHPFLAPLIIILWRIIGMVIPPIPGGILSFAMIPVLGWFWSYVYAVIGVTIGASIAFFIARKFREPVIKRFVPLQELHTWEKHQSQKKEFFAFLFIRLATGPVMDFVSYLAGLSKISFKKFLLATLIAEIPSIVGYYVGGEIQKTFSEKNSYIGLAIFLIFITVLYFFKDHTIFKHNKK